MLRATPRTSFKDDAAVAQVEEMVKSAKRKLQDSQFEDAELLFTKVIRMDPENMRALEGRAVSYERRGDYQKALSDARAIIKFSPSNAQGYLRCGKVLRLMDRLEDAVGIYKVGLKMVSKEDKLFSELQKQIDSLFEGSRRDIRASGLPIEVIVDLYSRLADPLPLACTSKTNLGAFQQFLRSCDALRIHSKLKAATLKSLLPNKSSILVEGPTALKNLLVAVKAASECSIESCEFVDCNRVEPFDLSRAISLGFFKTVKAVTVNGDTSEILFAAILSKATNLTNLRIANVKCKFPTVPIALSNLTLFMAVDSVVCKPLVQLLRDREMKSVHWDEPVDHTWSSSEYVNYIIDCQSSLERFLDNHQTPTKWIDLRFNTPLMAIAMDRLKCDKLLIMNGAVTVTEPTDIKQLYLKQCKVNQVEWNKFTRLNSLWLDGCVDGVEEQCLTALTSLPSLKELLIVGTTIRSPYLPATLLSFLPRLKVFGAVECAAISGPSLDGCDHVVQIKSRAEFEFIKKKKWSV